MNNCMLFALPLLSRSLPEMLGVGRINSYIVEFSSFVPLCVKSWFDYKYIFGFSPTPRMKFVFVKSKFDCREAGREAGRR